MNNNKAEGDIARKNEQIQFDGKKKRQMA